MKRFRKWIIILFGVVLILALLRVFLFSSFYISSNGMSSVLKAGDRVLVTKYSYGLSIPFSSKQINKKSPQYQDFVFIQNPLSYSTTFKEDVAYMGQVVGLPGDTLIINEDFQLISNAFRPLSKQTYSIDLKHVLYVDSISRLHNIPTEDVKVDSLHFQRAFNGYEAYIINSIDSDILQVDSISLQDVEFDLIIPKQGQSIEITPWNKSLIYNAILFHEQENLLLYQNDSIFLNGEHLTNYTFKQDYYWISVLDTHKTADSSTYGFVPKSNIIGKGRFIWFSKQPQTPFYTGYNWNRFFKSITQ